MKHNNARAVYAYMAHKSGRSFVMIAKKLGVSASRAQQLAVRGQELIRRERSGDPIYELSTRTRNVLVDCGCEMTPEGVAKRFAQFSPYQISRIVNFGDVSKLELDQWLLRHLAKARAKKMWAGISASAARMCDARAKVAAHMNGSKGL